MTRAGGIGAAVMQYIYNTTDFQFHNTAVSLGKFDGVHVGHRLLMSEVLKERKHGLSAAVFSFAQHPRKRIDHTVNRLIYTETEKKMLLEGLGLDMLVSYPFDDSVIHMGAEEFVRDILVGKMGAKKIVAGEDFCFGYQRQGTVRLLDQLSDTLGYQLKVIRKQTIGGEEVGSSLIRCCLLDGNMEKVNALLGSPFHLFGQVIHGNELGRTLGMPTANILPDSEKLLPPNGVYVSQTLVDGVRYQGITNIGTKPTVREEDWKDGKTGGKNRDVAETHLFDFSGDLYGRDIHVALLHYVRPEQKFADYEALSRQMHMDMEAARSYFLADVQ